MNTLVVRTESSGNHAFPSPETIGATSSLILHALEETGKGWTACRSYCHPDATFSCQAAALADVDTLAAYAEWMKGLFTPLPDGHFELRSFAVDEGRNNVAAYAVFRGIHTGEGGPVPPTGKGVEGDYALVMEFDDDRIRHVTKVWNDGFSMKQLGWM